MVESGSIAVAAGDVEKGLAHEVGENGEGSPEDGVAQPEDEQLLQPVAPIHSKQKIVLIVAVVCFVLLEAYFVGRSFRQRRQRNQMRAESPTDFGEPLTFEGNLLAGSARLFRRFEWRVWGSPTV